MTGQNGEKICEILNIWEVQLCKILKPKQNIVHGAEEEPCKKVIRKEPFCTTEEGL